MNTATPLARAVFVSMELDKSMTYQDDHSQTLQKGVCELQNDARTCKPVDTRLTQPCSLDVPELRRHLKQRLKTSPILRPHLSNLEQMLKSWDAAGTESTWPATSSGQSERSRPYGNPPHSAAYGDDDG
jgi:hypothetical protein